MYASQGFYWSADLSCMPDAVVAKEEIEPISVAIARAIIRRFNEQEGICRISSRREKPG